MSTAPVRLISSSAGELTRSSSGKLTINWDNVPPLEFDDLGEALNSMAAVAEIFSGEVEYGVPLNELQAAADAAGVTEIMAYSPNGWTKVDGYWVPSGLIPGYADPDESFETGIEYGQFGIHVRALSWDGIFVLWWKAPENSDSGWKMLGRVSVEAADERAKEIADEMQADWNLSYDEFIGLGNLPVSDRFELPSSARHLGVIRTSLYEWGDPAASVDVYRAGSLGSTGFLVGSGDVIVGTYPTWEELESAVRVEDAFVVSMADVDHSDEEPGSGEGDDGSGQ